MNIEDKMKIQRIRFQWHAMTIIFTVLLVVPAFIISCFLLFIRPKTSEIEKRDLTKFPKVTFESLLSGEYTEEVGVWFSDTFPFREGLLTAEQKLQTYYGIRKSSVQYVGQGDDIPDIEELLNQTEEPETFLPSDEVVEPSAETENPEIVVDVETQTVVEETVPVETQDQAAIADNGNQLVAGNPQRAGEVNVENLVGYAVYGFNLSAANQYCEDVAFVASEATNQNVYEILVPDNSAVMLSDELKTSWNLSDEEKVIAYYDAKLDTLTSKVNKVHIFDALKGHNSEYLYFYTDHHWTQLGAYYAYVEFCKAKGITPHDLSEYEQIVTYNFLGSYYASNGYTQLADNADTIVSYKPLGTNDMKFYDRDLQVMRDGAIIRDMNPFGDTLKYLGFIYGDNPISYIENPNASSDETCIIIKESFGNTFVPFLVDHYKKVVVVDYRYYYMFFEDSMAALAEKEGATDIIFINNLEAISDLWTMRNQLGVVCGMPLPTE